MSVAEMHEFFHKGIAAGKVRLSLPDHASGYLVCLSILTLFYSAFILLKSWQRKDPFRVPYTLPILKNTIPFVFDGLNFLRDAKARLPYGSTMVVPIFREDIYLVQGPKNVAEMFHSPQLTITRSWSLVLRQCFGMKQRAVDAYLADTSGTREKPIPGSNPRPQDRLSHMTHKNLTAGLLQNSSLGPATDRYREHLEQSLDEMGIGHDWAYMPDMTEFLQTHIGSSLIRTLFGERLLSQNPDFISDLWEYDEHVMSLAQRYPRIWIPKTYSIRDRLLAAVKKWHAEAVKNDEVSEFDDGKLTDSWWGTKMMKERYRLLLGGTGQDEDSVASTNLAFIWSSVTTVVPSSATMVTKLFSSEAEPLLSSLRTSLSRLPPSPTVKELESVPLLVSAYAETLRYGIHIHVPRSAPHHELQVQGVTIPKNSLILLNTQLAHTDEEVWDNHDGRHPLDQWCPERFLVDPKDPSSGPTRTKTAVAAEKAEKAEGGPYFSSEGLEGAWFPYGGGQHACPGRLLAKRIMLLTSAMLISNFDIEIRAGKEALEFGSPRFGFGVSKPSGPVPFRIRRRNHVCKAECAYFIDT
ncbi:unnamed protein product [Clonostachys solani]|uniref:Cytochrome P450 n=1 Tax=Clonostachys solani TaxID=160281 RepID=A0A9N9YVL3_9HYPO|nr:unnamed protein product [Clonostachys solani]